MHINIIVCHVNGILIALVKCFHVVNKNQSCESLVCLLDDTAVNNAMIL